VAEDLDTIVDVLFARSSSQDPAYVFLVDGTAASECRWTYADTANRSTAFAAWLSHRGVRRGERVVLAVNPSLDYIAALFGIMMSGAVPVPCFPPLRPKELDRFLAIMVDCAPQAIVIDAMYRDQMDALKDRLVSANLDPAILYVEDLVTHLEPAALATCSPDDLALIQYTSGSTGSPKGVCLTHDNLVSNCEVLARSMGGDPNRVGFSWLPPYHDMGLMGTIILSLHHGWPLVLMSPMHFMQEPRRWLEAITAYRVTITVGPNFSLDAAVSALDEDDDADLDADLDLSTLKEFYCGAEPISAATLARFEERAAPLGFDMDALIPCYGMAEATLFIAGKRKGLRYNTITGVDGVEGAVVSCGEVDSEHVVRIVDPRTGRPAGTGEVGEIWVSGRSVAAGYFNREALTKEVFHARIDGDGRSYLRTGDLGFVRDDELFVTGRIKDLIIVSGRNIYPQDVEASAVRSDPSLRRAVAFSVPGDGTERLVVVAEGAFNEVTTDSHTRLAESIRSSVTSEFGVGPDVHICRRRTIPTTTSGKVRRQEAKRLFLDGEMQRCPA
jgi:acyl-CoA synthetase (AMP-forming)/AMP-acid ligase II